MPDDNQTKRQNLLVVAKTCRDDELVIGRDDVNVLLAFVILYTILAGVSRAQQCAHQHRSQLDEVVDFCRFNQTCGVVHKPPNLSAMSALRSADIKDGSDAAWRYIECFGSTLATDRVCRVPR